MSTIHQPQPQRGQPSRQILPHAVYSALPNASPSMIGQTPKHLVSRFMHEAMSLGIEPGMLACDLQVMVREPTWRAAQS